MPIQRPVEDREETREREIDRVLDRVRAKLRTLEHGEIHIIVTDRRITRLIRQESERLA